MMKQLTVVLSAAIALMALIVAGCGGGSSSSSTDNTSPGGTTLPQSLSQSSIDNNTANNIINCTIDLYNQNVAGRSQGAYNGITVNCPNGGTALIQGLASKATNSNLTTTDLTYTMNNCVETKPDHSFTYTGVVTEKGSFDLSTSFVSETIQSTGNVTMNGTITITGFSTAPVNQTTTFTVNRGFNTSSGNIGGRAFSY
jgi:hypothetical protein